MVLTGSEMLWWRWHCALPSKGVAISMKFFMTRLCKSSLAHIGYIQIFSLEETVALITSCRVEI